MLDDNLKQHIISAQKMEITEHILYKKLAKATNDTHNKQILIQIADDELKHYNFWKKYTNRDVKPRKLQLWFYYLVARILGLTFGLKLMERSEHLAQVTYGEITTIIPEAKPVLDDAADHEAQLIALINEDFLTYVGSVILGLSDALVELTGALAGLTLALSNTRLIALTGLIIGIAASLSMGTSEYLSTKSEEGTKSPLKASIYTGTAYLITVLLLIAPYLLLIEYHPLICLTITIITAILIIMIFTFYISIAKDLSFKKRFFEVAGISLGVAALTFVLGVIVKHFLNVEI